jgi:hypothetical protein
MQDPYPTAFSAIITGEMSSEGFEADDFEVRTSSSVVDSLPAFVIGFASSVVLCAGYIVFSEARDRCKNQESSANESNTGTTGNKCHCHYMTSRGCQSIVAHSLTSRPGSVLLLPIDAIMANSTDSVHFYEKGPDSQVYPVIVVSIVSHARAVVQQTAEDYPDHQLLEERSLSPVSTITSSVTLESTDSNSGILELTEFHRVSKQTKLESLVNLGEVSASPASQSSRSKSTFSLKRTKRSDAHDVLKKVWQEQEEVQSSLGRGIRRKTVCDFDGVMAQNSSVMADESIDDVHSISAEDETGWTSCGGKSDSSSEVSSETFLKSTCSARSRSSARTVTTNKSSVLLGESLATSPNKIAHQESREDENSMEFSLEDDSISLTEPRTDNDHEMITLLTDILRTDRSSGSSSERVKGEEIEDIVAKLTDIEEGVSKEEKGVDRSDLASFEDSTDVVTSGSCKGLTFREDYEKDFQASATEGRTSSTQLSEFLGRNKIVRSEATKEASIGTSKSSSFKDGSALSETGSTCSSSTL